MKYRVYMNGRIERSFNTRPAAVNYIVDTFGVEPEDEDEGTWNLGMTYPNGSERAPNLEGSRSVVVKIVEDRKKLPRCV